MKKAVDVRSHDSLPSGFATKFQGAMSYESLFREFNPETWLRPISMGPREHCVPGIRKDPATHCLHPHIQCVRQQERWGRGVFVLVFFKN